jgi:hypothetical protein
MELSEMGPSLDLEVRRRKEPPVELEKEATKQPKLDKKKVGGGLGKQVMCVQARRGQSCWGVSAMTAGNTTQL